MLMTGWCVDAPQRWTLGRLEWRCRRARRFLGSQITAWVHWITLVATLIGRRSRLIGGRRQLDYVVFMFRQVGAIFATMVVLWVGVGCGPGTATPEALRIGRGVYADNCSACHGNRGQGGVGPKLSNVRDTWPSCDSQQEWIGLGSEGWKIEHGPVYGADDTPIENVMPGQADNLTSERSQRWRRSNVSSTAAATRSPN